jgi:hypothetical protein
LEGVVERAARSNRHGPGKLASAEARPKLGRDCKKKLKLGPEMGPERLPRDKRQQSQRLSA